jgi:hypothetical protein
MCLKEYTVTLLSNLDAIFLFVRILCILDKHQPQIMIWFVSSLSADNIRIFSFHRSDACERALISETLVEWPSGRTTCDVCDDNRR